MPTSLTRRAFAAATLVASTAGAQTRSIAKVARLPGAAVRIALNAYSFNQPLRDKTIDWNGVIDYCAQHGIGALDATGY